MVADFYKAGPDVMLALAMVCFAGIAAVVTVFTFASPTFCGIVQQTLLLSACFFGKLSKEKFGNQADHSKFLPQQWLRKADPIIALVACWALLGMVAELADAEKLKVRQLAIVHTVSLESDAPFLRSDVFVP